MRFETLEDVLAAQLGSLRAAELQLVELPARLAAASLDGELQAAFEADLETTRRHRSRLEWIARSVDLSLPAVPGAGIRGLVEEVDGAIESGSPSLARDVALIGLARRIEHVEIALYSTARDLAKLLFYSEVESLLDATLEEERRTDAVLVRIAAGAFARTGMQRLEVG